MRSDAELDRRLVRRRLVNTAATVICLVLAVLAASPLLSLLWELWLRGHAALSWDFLTKEYVPPMPPELEAILGRPEPGGIGHAILGTTLMVGLGTAIGAPFGILSGIYLAEFGRNRLGDFVRTVTDALSAIPSIVAGLFAFGLVSLLVTQHSPYMPITASLALAVIMLPVVARTTEEAMRTVPDSLREASLALGGSSVATTFKVVVPAAWGAMSTGLLLAVARIAGETAPLVVTMIPFNFYSADLTGSMATLPAYIYNGAKSAQLQDNEQAWGAALVLISGILLINIVVRLLGRRGNEAA